MLSSFNTAKFRFTLRPLTTISLPPYKGFVLRGGFGYAFRRVACAIKRSSCDGCLLVSKCAYSYIFETTPPDSAVIMRKYTNVPRPFVIEPPLERKNVYHQDDILDFNLVIIGKAINYLPYFIYAFDELGKMGIGRDKGRFQLESVTHISTSGVENKVYSGSDKTLYGFQPDFFKFEKLPSSKLTMEFLTPTRIVFGEKLTEKIEFHHLVRGLLRRISLLSYFHCGKRLEFDFKGMIQKVTEQVQTVDSKLAWHDLARYSTRQKIKMKMGGVTGKITFKGNFDGFGEIIKLGEIIHTGKATTFGYGKYLIVN